MKQQQSTTNNNRLYSTDLDTLISTTQPITPFDIETLNVPQTEKNMITILAFQPANSQAYLPSKLLLDTPLIDSLTLKLFELIEIMNNADNDSYPNHLSLGSIDNVFTSAVRRCYLVGCNKDIYPFVLINPELNHLMSKVFIFIYKSYLTNPSILKPALSLYAMVCFQFSCFTSAVRFNVSTPFRDSMYWQQVYDTMIDVAIAHDIPLHKIERKWISN